MMPFMTQPAVAPACYVPGYKIDHSQRAYSDANTQRYMTRNYDLTGEAYYSHRKLWTHNFWHRRGSLTKYGLWADCSANYNSYIGFPSDSTLSVNIGNSSVSYAVYTTAKFRDASAFMNVHVVYDADNPVSAERIRVWINGVRQTMTTSVPPQGFLPAFLTAPTRLMMDSASYYADGEFAAWHCVTGVALEPSAFIESNIHGVMVPKVYEGDHGKGWFLDFSDPLNPGKDVSGKGNHFTAMGFDATGNVSSSPTNVYATLNPLDKSAVLTLSDGGLAYQGTSAGCGLVRSTLPLFDGVYWEAAPVAGSGSSQCHGVAAPSGVMEFTPVTGMAYWYATMSHAFVNGAEVPVSVSYDTADTLGLAYRAGRLYFRKNGVWVIGDPETATGGLDVSVLGDRLYALHGDGTTYAAGSAKVNFGQRPFAYAPPVGFKPLCTDNLPEPDIKDPAEAFVQVATTGANMDGALTALTEHWDGAPYVEIIKCRDASGDWRVRFSDDPGNAWATNNALAKVAAPPLVLEGAYVGYRLRVGARYGIWTAEVPHTTGTATTVTHGLNTARNVVIATRVSASGGDRHFRHPDMPATFLGELNSTIEIKKSTDCAEFGSNSFQIASDAASGIYRVIVLAERPGYLALPSWSGIGSEDGPFVPLDISPLFMLSRQSGGVVGVDGSGDWEVLTEATSPVNPRGNRLFLNTDWKEDIQLAPVDFVAGGVKLRAKNADWNEEKKTYYGIAIGRPVGGVCVAPVPAR